LQTEPVEAKALDWTDVAYAGPRRTGDEPDLLFERELRDEVLGLLESAVPAVAGCVGC
jgi:hypothetical protein